MRDTRYEVVLRNGATGGPVRKVYRPMVAWSPDSAAGLFDHETARELAARFNERENRAHRNVYWTTREVEVER